MKVLVTGASGFIGHRIVKRLLANGHSVIGSGLTPGKIQPTDFQYIVADLSQLELCKRLVHGIDAVIHCAGKAGAWGPREDYYRANVTATENMLAASRAGHVQRFINLSSPSIYFEYKDQLDLKENNRPAVFSNAYAETKYLAEQQVTKANSERLKTISLRPRGVIGAGDRNWLPRIIEMRETGQLIQPGSGSNLVDFTAVENLVDAIDLALNTGPQNCGRVYNVSDGQPERLWDFIEYSLKQVGLDGRRRHVPTFVAMFAARCIEKYHLLRHTKKEPEILPIKVGVAAYSMTLDISDAKKYLGYSPRVKSREAIDEFAKWWMAHKKTN